MVLFDNPKINKYLMAEHNDKGKEAENLAKDWLIGRGYEFVEANYRSGHAEIDLIFKHKGILVFVEVKFRSGTGFGYAEEFVDGTKRKLFGKHILQIDFMPFKVIPPNIKNVGAVEVSIA